VYTVPGVAMISPRDAARLGGEVVNKIDVPKKGPEGFKDDKLIRCGGAIGKGGKDWFTVSQTLSDVVDINKFSSVFAGKKICHLKGFTSGMGEYYDQDIMQQLSEYNVVVIDGDDPPTKDGHQGSFTRFVVKFLEQDAANEVASFKIDSKVPSHQKAYAELYQRFPNRIRVIPIALASCSKQYGVTAEIDAVKLRAPNMPSFALEFTALGRIAQKVTGTHAVISLGGGGIAKEEALLGLKDGTVQWTVYALSRGRNEEHPTLCDFAMEDDCPKNVRFVQGKDPNERKAFKQ